MEFDDENVSAIYNRALKSSAFPTNASAFQGNEKGRVQQEKTESSSTKNSLFERDYTVPDFSSHTGNTYIDR